MPKEAGKINVGILAFQGGIEEHLRGIKELGHNGIEVKIKKDLNALDALILPGGESTTIGTLLKVTGLINPLREKIKNGLPTWGTCAGMILLAKEIENDEKRYLNLMDIKVRRNAFGTQIDSFTTKKVIPEISVNELDLVFIRAPFITEINNNVQVLCRLGTDIVAVKQDNMIATSFHPELTDDLAFLNFFLNTLNNQ